MGDLRRFLCLQDLDLDRYLRSGVLLSLRRRDLYLSLCLSRDVRLRLRLLLLGGLSRLRRLGGSREYDLLLRSRRRVTSRARVPNSLLSALGVLATAVSCLGTAGGSAAAGLTCAYVTTLGISSLVADADQFPGTGTAGKLGQGGFGTGP